MNKKMAALVIIPIIGLIFVISTPEPDTENLPESDIEKIAEPVNVEPVSDVGSSQLSAGDCSGSAKCIVGTVTKIIDGSSIHVDDHYVRFALASSPTLKSQDGMTSKNFIQTICPVGSQVLVDEDDGQNPEGPNRIIGVVYCNDMILNKELLDTNLGYLSSRFCESSEFANESWAQKHGCNNMSDSENDASS